MLIPLVNTGNPEKSRNQNQRLLTLDRYQCPIFQSPYWMPRKRQRTGSSWTNTWQRRAVLSPGTRAPQDLSILLRGRLLRSVCVFSIVPFLACTYFQSSRRSKVWDRTRSEPENCYEYSSAARNGALDRRTIIMIRLVGFSWHNAIIFHWQPSSTVLCKYWK